jgi:hypothetical protein
MQRRKFLGIAAGGIGISIVALSGFFASKNFRKVIFEILRHDLKGLKVSKETLEKYIADAEKENFWGFTEGKIQFIKAHHNIPIPLPYAVKYRHFKSIIVGTYLLSTDFFLNKMDVAKPVNYLAYYNPYKRPCYNPFSNLYYPS